MKLISITTIFLLLIISCEKFFTSYIENATDNDIIMIAKMDTSITKHYSKVSNVQFLNSYANDSTSIILKLDTINFIGVYRLKKKAIIRANFGPPGSKFNYLQFRTPIDTITYYSHLEIQRAFEQDTNRMNYILKVK